MECYFFLRFCLNLFNNKTFAYENFKIDYCFVKQSVTIAEAPLNEIQFYRRPLAFIFFTVCHTSEQLHIALDHYKKIKRREKDCYIHLFVRYINESDNEEDESSFDDKFEMEALEQS